MTSTTFEYRSHSSEQLSPPKIPLPSLRSAHSACTIDIKSTTSSSSSSSSFSLDNETKNENIICSSLSNRQTNSEYFRKSNSLDSGYKTLSAASHGTSHTDTIDEENERMNSFLQIASSPSSCSSSSYAVSNTNNNQKTNTKIEFIVDDEDDVDDKQSNILRKNSKSNTDGLSSSGERRSRRNSLSNYSVSNYSVLLNEFCCTSSDQIDQTIHDEKIIKKKSGFANTVATFFSSKKKDDEQQIPITPTKKINRSRSVSETSLERTTINQDSIEPIKPLSIECIDEQIDNETKSKKMPTTTTYTIPSKGGKISTQSLLTTSSSTNNNQHTSSLSHSFSWLHRLSNRFNSSTLTTRTITTATKTSSTGLIFENRPINLPPKSNEETLKHQVEYQKMCFEAKRAQQLFDEKEEQRQRLKLKREEFVSKSLKIWTHDILPCWDKYGGIDNCPDLTLNSKAYKLWWHGLPPRIRGKIWKMAIGNELGLTYELFTQLEQMAREKLEVTKQAEDARSNHSGSPQLGTTFSHSSETTSTYIELIQLDVSRTFPQLGLFQQHGPYHEYLQLLLCIYVYLCPEVGYVQGQAFLAAMFLLNLDLFDSFICFSNLLNRPYFQTFYRFNNIDKYLQLFKQLLNYHLPKLSAHFIHMSIEPNCFALDWFFTIFSKSLPLDVVSRIWDLFFRDGDAFIFRTAIAILSLYEERLCQLDTFHCLQFLTRLPDDLNVTSLFKAIDKINFDHTNCELFYLIA
ncbi:unnamed protein product [Rotaria sp. Silwood1]|nr:unnamed protein product [Rotaria sp. Silwood1]CAF3431762.1 unnamed protein product [Rotaria sp. Silwood1]CAF3436045.1 unnamed protein product [Rotaria sp. Silwood1]CAF4577602.1 unnamed protein product [Rotaria sp. Silwood1]CAF4746405.1 unnamed protein product [Rotaria sp. Silwood1]